MTKQVETYYLSDEMSRIVFWTTDDEAIEERPDLIFLGSSMNPNRRMAVAAFTHKLDQPHGWTIKELP